MQRPVAVTPALFSVDEALIYEEITEESLSHMVEKDAGKPSPAELHGEAFADAGPVRLRTVPDERTAPGTEQDTREQAPGHVLVTFFTKHHCADCRRARQVITDTGNNVFNIFHAFPAVQLRERQASPACACAHADRLYSYTRSAA